MSGWCYLYDGRKIGPVDETALSELLEAGAVSPAVSVRAEGEEVWSRLDERLPHLLRGARSTLPASAPERLDWVRVEPPPGSAWRDTKPHPWRRYFARMADNLIVGTLTWFVIVVAGYIAAPTTTGQVLAVLSGPVGNLLNLLLTLVVAIPGNALMIGLTGISIGKWIFGVKVVRPDGRPIGIGAAFLRELDVWFRGMGFGIPLISLITLIISCQTLANRGTALWDPPSERVVVYRRAGAFQTILMIIGIPAVLAAAIALRLLGNHG